MDSGVAKRMRIVLLLSALSISAFFNIDFASAHDHGANKIHEVKEGQVPTISLDVKKDPTGGFNVQVLTTNFRWTPEKASATHVEGEGHAHVYLADQKIIRLYNSWFHLNTFQFASTSGEQLLRVELVGNDHAPITADAQQIYSEQLIDVVVDEIRPGDPDFWMWVAFGAGALALLFAGAALAMGLRRNSSKA